MVVVVAKDQIPTCISHHGTFTLEEEEKECF